MTITEQAFHYLTKYHGLTVEQASTTLQSVSALEEATYARCFILSEADPSAFKNHAKIRRANSRYRINVR